MTAGLTAAPTQSRTVPIALLIWLLAALALGPWLFALPFPAPQLGVLALAVVATIGLGKWLDGLPWRSLVGMHAVRFVGITFLILSARGVLAPVVASRAGWGNIIAALGAVGLAFAGPRPKWLAYLWNSFGLLVFVVSVGTLTFVARSGAIPGVEPLTHLPLNLVPTFFIPLLIASHVAIFRRIHAS